MKLLGIVAALPAEVRSLTNQAIAAGGLIQLREGALLQLSGIGAKRAGWAAEALLEKGATALLSWGCAGGLHARVSPGDLVLPKVVIAADQTLFPTDAAWHERLYKHLSGHVELHTAPLAETPGVVSRPEEKAALFERYGAIAVDMESAAVARVAEQHTGVPFIAIRAVVDPADTPIPPSALSAIDDHGRLQPLRLLGRLARHPAELFLLIRLRRHFRAARTTLVMVARLAGSNLLAS